MALSRFRGLRTRAMVSKGRDASMETSMLCPHDHQACDNRGCRYGGCQGRPSRELVAHRDPHFSKNIVVESQNGGTVPAVSGSSAGIELCK